jgi:tripartite ATP-independent transporter DctP family solute receptor
MRVKKILLVGMVALTVIWGLGSVSLAQAPVVLKMGHIFTPTSAMHLSSQVAADLVETRSKGKLKIQIFPGAQLGAMLDEVEGVKMGTQDLTMVWGIDRFCPEFSLFNSPFVFRDEEHLYDVCMGPLGQQYIQQNMLKRHGIRIIGMIYHGVRMLTTDEKHPVKKPEDVKGLRLRTPDITAWIKSWQSIGAKVTAFPWGELYMALKQGVVDAQENPLASIHAMKFYEVQKNIILTGHITDYPFVMINDKKFQSLDKNLQGILVQAFNDARYYSIGKVRREAHDNLKFFKEKGLNIVEVNLAEWQKAFSKSAELFEGGRQLYDKIQAVK